jgi:hypothetical protein
MFDNKQILYKIKVIDTDIKPFYKIQQIYEQE